MVTRFLFATIGDRRLRVCGFLDDGTPVLVDGATVIGLAAAAREAGIEPDSVVLEEAEA